MGGEARSHEAEIEAELRVRSFSVAHVTGDKRKVVFLDVALDALRRSPRRYACGVNADMEVTCDACPDPDGCIDTARRSPQGEDHEAGIEAAYIHYDADSRRWMVRVDQFVSRPATEREVYGIEVARFQRAIREALDALGAEEAEDIWERELNA